MRVLVVISILAASGLVWASWATAQHVRRTRRQHRSFTAQPQEGRAVEMSDRDIPQVEVQGSPQPVHDLGLARAPASGEDATPVPPPPPGPRSLVQAWALMSRVDPHIAAGPAEQPSSDFPAEQTVDSEVQR